MTTPRPLRDLFAELAGHDPSRQDVATLLHRSGHGDLPDLLVGDAIVNHVDTAPLEVAEHLAPFVTAHTALAPADADGTTPDPLAGLELLSTVPVSGAEMESDGVGDEPDLDFGAGAPEPPGGRADDPTSPIHGEPTEGILPRAVDAAGDGVDPAPEAAGATLDDPHRPEGGPIGPVGGAPEDENDETEGDGGLDA